MKPAMTAEEWRYPRLYFRGGYSDKLGENDDKRGEPTEGSVGGRDYTYGVELVVTPSTRDDPPLWVWDGSWAVEVPRAIRHGLAALSLKDQAFGFTWEDVAVLTECWKVVYRESRDLRAKDSKDVYGKRLYNVVQHTKSIVNRIQALLPPETT